MNYVDGFVETSHKLGRLFSKTVLFKSHILDACIDDLSASVGLRSDNLRLMASMFLSYPLAYLQTLLPTPRMKKSMSIIIGIAILQFCFDASWIHSLISSTFVLLLMRYTNPKKQPIYVFVFSMAYLSLSALYTMLTDYMSYALDSTVYQMILISRFQMLAWSVYDGTVDKVNVDEGAKQNDRMGRVYKRRQREYVTSLPTLLDYYAFVYHFPGLLGGPNTFYREFYDVMNNVRYPGNRIPTTRFRTAGVNFIKAVLFLALYVAGSIYLPTEYMLTDTFRKRSFVLRVVLLYLTYFCVRCRYFGLWKLGESICNVAGYGEQTERDGSVNWDGISNVDILAFETSTNMSSATRSWNKRTQKWLQMCIYERSNFNQLYVFLVSAFWHGFYPSYYLCFLVGSALQALNRHTAMKLWPRVEHTWMETPYLVLGNITVISVGSFMLAAMFSFSFDVAWKTWGQVNYFGLFLLGGAYAVLLCIPTVKKEKQQLGVCSNNPKHTTLL